MMWFGNGSWGGGWWWLGGGVFMVVCMWMMVRMMSHGAHGHYGADNNGFASGHPHERATGRSEEILADRFARGEIDVEEYERRLAVLRQRSETAEK